MSKEDLIYDTKEFLWKLEWKAHFSELEQDDGIERGKDIHSDLRIPSRSHPIGFSNPLFDDIKTKILGLASNIEPKNVTSNLTKAELRGKSILLKKIDAKELFVTRADKGGATLIVDWDIAVDSIKHELSKTDKFVELPTTIDEKMMEIKKLIIATVCDKESKNDITPNDRKLITGVNDKGNLCHSHVFIPTIPYAYPLYKIHKLSQEQIREKVIPHVDLCILLSKVHFIVWRNGVAHT